MQEGLLKKIQKVGHWRVNIRPRMPAEKLLLATCTDVVSKSNVSLRGWDYPHFQRNNDHGGHANYGEYVENWCDWRGHAEFWRMYRSTQYLHYRALWEDLARLPHMPELPVLSVLSAVYSVTEIVEFCSRLFREGLYVNGAYLSVTIGKVAGRQLWMSEPERMPFIDEKKTMAETIAIERDLSPEVLAESPGDESIGMLLELFDHFGWNPDRSLIVSDQTRFYQKQF